MDSWARKKAAAPCGGLGMTKFVDSNESRRLRRLRSTKSSISSKTSHTGWQKQQIEKRRKEQLRQRKRDAKKKQLGDGIHVDTKISKADAVSKAGLKLKERVVAETASGVVQHRRAKALESSRDKRIAAAPPVRVPQMNQHRHEPNEKNNRRKAPVSSKLPLLGDRSNVSNGNGMARKSQPVPKQEQRSQRVGVKPRFRPDEGKENSDNSTKREPSIVEDTGAHAAVPTKKPASTKKYFTMDINSLRREHADAIKMLEELDKCEGNRRRSLDSDNSIESSSYDSRASYVGMPNYRASNTLDDEFVKDCSIEDGHHAVSDSFLNMSHLSISLRDDFDGEGGGGNLTPTKNRSFSYPGEEGGEGALTPTKNRSFTSSCASIEDSDFFGDADIGSCTSDEGGYSSGTF